MQKIKLKIDGMHCSSCAMSIDFDLEDLDGIVNSRTNYAKEECEIEFIEEKIKIEQILSQIKNTGYKAKLDK